MKSHAISTDIFNVVSNFFQKTNLLRESLVGAGTGGAPAMLGLQSFRG